MIYLDLFIGFLKVGLFSFGGAYAAIPLIRDVVLAYGWMSDEELTTMIAISESTPGPIMVNVATYVGSSQGGFLGALIATFSVVIPAFFIVVLILTALKKVSKNKYVQAVVGGLKPGITGIILATGAVLILNTVVNVKDFQGINIKSFVVLLLLYAAMFIYKKIIKKKMSPFLLIAISACLGIAIL